MTAPQLTESLSDRLTALKCPLPDGLIARARTGAEAFSPPAVRTAASKDEGIEATNSPARLPTFAPAAHRPHHRALNRLAGTVGIAVVAVAVATFGLELSGHVHSTAPAPVPGGKAVPTSTPKPTPSSPAASSLPTGARVLIPPTSGTGTETLPTVTLGPNEGIWIAYSCSSNTMPFNSIFVSGRGVPVFLGPNFEFWLHQFSTPNRCSGTLPTDGGQGGPLTVRFNAVRPSVTWTVALYEYPSQAILSAPSPWETAPSFPGSTPPFLDAPAPRGAKVLIKITYGSGSETLPTVTVARNVPLVIEGGCISTSASANVLTIGSGDPAFDGSEGIGQCFYGTSAGGGGGGPVGSGAGGPLTLRVVAAPSVRWVILVYEGGGSTSLWGPPA